MLARVGGCGARLALTECVRVYGMSAVPGHPTGTPRSTAHHRHRSRLPRSPHDAKKCSVRRETFVRRSRVFSAVFIYSLSLFFPHLLPHRYTTDGALSAALSQASTGACAFFAARYSEADRWSKVVAASIASLSAGAGAAAGARLGVATAASLPSMFATSEDTLEEVEAGPGAEAGLGADVCANAAGAGAVAGGAGLRNPLCAGVGAGVSVGAGAGVEVGGGSGAASGRDFTGAGGFCGLIRWSTLFARRRYRSSRSFSAFSLSSVMDEGNREKITSIFRRARVPHTRSKWSRALGRQTRK